MGNRDLALDIEDYSGLNFDADVLDTIVESSHSGSETSEASNSDDILEEEHWATDSFEELKVDQEF